MLRSAIFYLCFFPWTILVIIGAVPFSLFGAQYMHKAGRIWAKFILWMTGVRLVVEGREHLPPDQRPVIYVGNHQSNFDILCYFAGLPVQFRWMAKEELFHIPLFGLAMRRSGYIPIDRKNRRKAMDSLKLAAARIAEGTSVVIFPEGTRSADGRLCSFKKGGFLMALKAQVPLVPVAISGSWRVMRKGTLTVRPGTIHMKILPAIEPSGRDSHNASLLMQRVWEQLAKVLDEE